VVPAFLRPDQNSVRFILSNQGLAPAREVHCELEALDGLQPRPVLRLDEVLPVELRPGQSMEFVASGGLGFSALIRAVVRWVDDAGKQEESFTLNTL
jgi:hypothetical protein